MAPEIRQRRAAGIAPVAIEVGQAPDGTSVFTLGRDAAGDELAMQMTPRLAMALACELLETVANTARPSASRGTPTAPPPPRDDDLPEVRPDGIDIMVTPDQARLVLAVRCAGYRAPVTLPIECLPQLRSELARLQALLDAAPRRPQ